MNLSEIDWDFNVAGSWPLLIKAAAVSLVFIFIMILGVYFITLDQLTELEKLETEEQTLKTSYEAKQRKSVNLSGYREQLKQIEASLDEMIKQMPTKAEVADLLIDISQTGLASGLEFRLFKPADAIRKDFYSELPIRIKVIGKYEEIGIFVSGLASLPRIVTVHDVSITPKNNNMMVMDAIIKTYNEESGAVTKKKGRRI